MKATDFMGQEIERLQRAAMDHSSLLDKGAEARKMFDLRSAYSAAQAFVNVDSLFERQIEQLARQHQLMERAAGYGIAMESLLEPTTVLDIAKSWHENQSMWSAFLAINPALDSLASKIATEFEESQNLLRQQLGLSAAHSIVSAIPRDLELAYLKGHAASRVPQDLQDAIELSKGLQTSFALARAAGTAGVEKAIAHSIEALTDQYEAFDIKYRLREIVDGMSTFNLDTTAALVRFHGIDGLASQMTAFGIEPNEFLGEEYLKTEEEGLQTHPVEHPTGMLSADRLDVLRQIVINIIAAYIWTLFLAPTIPNPDLDEQNKKIAKIESLIEMLPQRIESHVENIIRKQLGEHPTTFIVKDRRARLCAEPVSGAPVIALVFPNQKITLLEERGKWIKVEFYDYLTGTTREGWLLKKYCLRLPVTQSHYLREHELENAIAQSNEDLAAGRFVIESAEEHMARIAQHGRSQNLL